MKVEVEAKFDGMHCDRDCPCLHVRMMGNALAFCSLDPDYSLSVRFEGLSQGIYPELRRNQLCKQIEANSK